MVRWHPSAFRRLCSAALRQSTHSSPTGRLTPRPAETLCAEAKAVYDTVLQDRTAAMARISASDSRSSLTNADGSLIGPWNAMVCASPAIGTLVERMGSACRHASSCPQDLAEIGILVVGKHWQSQFEWYAHERLARASGVSSALIECVKRGGSDIVCICLSRAHAHFTRLNARSLQ